MEIFDLDSPAGSCGRCKNVGCGIFGGKYSGIATEPVVGGEPNKTKHLAVSRRGVGSEIA